ncbi:MAG: glycosyltransferase family 39 protein [Candidatus Omnitrophica bacterium]|nr:glycosyltransferase family 39 protein [Candidatus Omnitrophota bacterium]
MFIENLKKWALSAPGKWDAGILSVFILLITWHPFYLWGRINLFEMGLYLPGVDAILHGQIPYRDFLHLRGPFELYIPAWAMHIVGRNFLVIPTYFYLGTLVTLIVCILIAKEIFSSRIFLYSMTLAFVARTFPRVSFTIGGGFRFAWGLAAVYCVLQYLKNKKGLWMVMAGIFSAIGLMTSIEIGVYAFGSIFLTLCFLIREKLFKSSILFYSIGAAIILFPMCLFLQLKGAFIPMLDSYYQISANMIKTFPQVDPVPQGLGGVLAAMVNPKDVNFKQMTPLFCYVGVLVYGIYLYRRKAVRLDILCLALYGLFLFIGSMRSLWGPAFESALQPEKLLFFFLLERLWTWMKDSHQRRRQVMAGILLVSIFLSTVVYALPRYQKRFYAAQMTSCLMGKMKRLSKLFPFSDQDLVSLSLPGMQGMVVPEQQARDFQEVSYFINSHTQPQDRIVFFPDLGVYHFIVNRPFVGRFPIVSLSWISPQWHREFMTALEAQTPKYVVMYKQLPDYLPTTQLVVPANQEKYTGVMNYVHENYQIIDSTPSLNIWQRKL